MTQQRAPVSSALSAMLVTAIAHHVRKSAICNGQARAIFELEKKARPDVARDFARQRATHELEEGLHAAALTSITCTLANLEAHGFEVRGLLTVQGDCEDHEARRPGRVTSETQ